MTPEGVETVVVEVPAQPSGLGWLPDGSLVIASMTDHRVLRYADGELTTLAEIGDHVGGHVNDLVVDAAGHIYVGNFGFDLMGGGAPAPANLVRVDPDGTVAVVATDLHFPNGSVITPDGTTLIVGETTGNRYTAFDHRCRRHPRRTAGCGPSSAPCRWPRRSRRAWGQIKVAPDGCTLDAEGHIWAADALGNRASASPRAARSSRRSRCRGTSASTPASSVGTTAARCCCARRRTSSSTTAPRAREAVLLTTTVDVPHAGLP